MGGKDTDHEKLADDLVSKALGILDPQMRSIYMTERLDSLGDADVVEVLNIIFAKANRRISKYQKVLVGFMDRGALSDALGSYKISRIYHGAKRLGYDEVVRFLSQPRQHITPDQDEESAFKYGLTQLTMGERRFLAKQKDVHVLDKLTYDLEPLVIRELLKNPRITENHVIKIASRRPIRGELLEEIFQNSRWVSQYKVKEALVRNPYTPVRIALGLVTFIMEPTLRDVAWDESLHAEVREAARDILVKKRSGGKKSGKE